LTERRYVVLDLFEFHAIAGDDVDLQNLLVDRDKVEEVEYLPGEQELEFLRRVVPEKDLPIVGVALGKPATSVVIITTDKRHLVDNEALKAYLKRVNPGVEVIHLDEYVKLDP
jgi:cell division protein FtsX